MSVATRTLSASAATLARVRHSAPVTTGDIRERSTFPGTVVALYIFLLNSRVLDLSFLGYFRIPLMLLVSLTVMMLAKGDFQFGMSSKVTKYFAALTGWVIVCWPFSVWRGGSTETVKMQVESLLIFFLIVQLVRTRRDWEKVAGAYAYAVLAASLLSFYIGVAIDGRIALPNGVLGDPNQFAIFMTVGLPFWWLKAARATGFKKVLFLLCTLPVYPAIARAGSRSGMVAALVLVAATFLFANGGRKVMIAAVAVAGLAISFVALPGYLRVRYLTIFSMNGDYDAATAQRLGADIQSSEGRKELLIQSIKMSFTHPLFGVGPGVFYAIGFEERKAEHGNGGQAYQTHNTYTQMSSETGLPGFFLFAGTVFLCFRYTLRDYQALKKVDPEFAKCGRYMVTSMTSLACGIFFLSVGYTYLLSMIFALATALHIMVERYLNEQAATASRSVLPGPGVGAPAQPGFTRPARAFPPRPRRPVHARPNRYPSPVAPSGTYVRN